MFEIIKDVLTLIKELKDGQFTKDDIQAIKKVILDIFEIIENFL